VKRVIAATIVSVVATWPAQAFELRPLPEGTLPAVHAARNGVYLVRWTSGCQQIDQGLVKSIVNHFEAQAATTQSGRKAVDEQLRTGIGKTSGWITSTEIEQLKKPLNQAQCNRVAAVLTKSRPFIAHVRQMAETRRDSFSPMRAAESLSLYDALIIDIGRAISPL
jgi:hypothetical protein